MNQWQRHLDADRGGFKWTKGEWEVRKCHRLFRFPWQLMHNDDEESVTRTAKGAMAWADSKDRECGGAGLARSIMKTEMASPNEGIGSHLIVTGVSRPILAGEDSCERSAG